MAITRTPREKQSLAKALWKLVQGPPDEQNLAAIKSLLDAGAEQSCHDAFLGVASYPMHIAVSQNNLAVVKLLLEHKADLTQQDGFKHLAIEKAAAQQFWQVVMALLQSPQGQAISPHVLGAALWDAVRFACADKDSEAAVAAVELLDKGAVATRTWNFVFQEGEQSVSSAPFDIAMHYQHKELIMNLVMHGAELDKENEQKHTPLEKVAKKNKYDAVIAYSDAVKQLKENKGAARALTARHQQSLAKALWTLVSRVEKPHNEKTIAAITSLLAAGAEQTHHDRYGDKDMVFPMHLAVYKADQDLARLMLDHKADLTQQNANHFTPMTLASSICHRNWPLVSAMMASPQSKALNPDVLGAVLWDAVRDAGARKRPEAAVVAVELLRMKANPDCIYGFHFVAEDYDKLTAPLDLAMYFELNELITALILQGANVAQENEDKQTPLERAVQHKKTSSVIVYNKATHQAQEYVDWVLLKDKYLLWWLLGITKKNGFVQGLIDIMMSFLLPDVGDDKEVGDKKLELQDKEAEAVVKKKMDEAKATGECLMQAWHIRKKIAEVEAKAFRLFYPIIHENRAVVSKGRNFLKDKKELNPEKLIEQAEAQAMRNSKGLVATALTIAREPAFNSDSSSTNLQLVRSLHRASFMLSNSWFRKTEVRRKMGDTEFERHSKTEGTRAYKICKALGSS